MKNFINFFKRDYGELLGNNALNFVVSLSLIAGIIAFIWSYSHGYIYAYGDAKSHLNIARRLIDSRTPGAAQLGSSWLPLYHLMMVPLIWNDFLWHSGIAGTYINYILYVASVVLLFKSILLITKQRLAATFGSLLFALNTNVLYLQAAAMSEISSVFFIIASIYLFIRWQKERKIPLLILLGVCCFLGSLDRYEMWAMAGAVTLGIILSNITIKEIKKINFRKLEGELVMFCTLAFFGVFIWLLWNLLIFNDPLNFSHSIYSAKAYQSVIISLYYNVFYHNLPKAFLYYFVDSADVNTWSLTIIGLLGSAYYLLRNRSLESLAFVGVCISIFVFESYSIFSGNSSIYIPQLYPYDYYNIRYGIYAIPFLILFTSYLLAMKNKILPIILALILFYETAIGYKSMPITLYDSSFSTGPILKNKPQNAQAESEAATYLHNHYTGGYILTSAGVNDAIIFLANLPMYNFITEGNGKYWNEALKNPSKNAAWIVQRRNYDYAENIRNTLLEVLTGNNKLDAYKLVFTNSQIEIYQRQPEGSSAVKNTKKMLAAKIVEAEKPSKKQCSYVIQPGDTLWKVAKKTLGDGKNTNKLIELNKSDDNFDLPTVHPGQKLIIPCEDKV